MFIYFRLKDIGKYIISIRIKIEKFLSKINIAEPTNIFITDQTPRHNLLKINTPSYKRIVFL